MTTPKSPAKPTKVDATKAGSKWDKNLKKGWVIISGKRYVKQKFIAYSAVVELSFLLFGIEVILKSNSSSACKIDPA